MPIKNMTHQQPQFPEIGQLRKGGTKEQKINQKGEKYETFGKDLDHFRFTSEIPEVQAAFEAIYDGQPRMVNVLLPFAQVDENWEAWQEEYKAGGLVHRCDGETCVLSLKPDGSYSTERKPCPYANGKVQRTPKEPGCKPTGRLKVIIPELRRLAYVTVLTNSTHDIRNLDAQLRALESLRQDLRGIPLQLRRSLKTISTPGKDGKRARRQKWLLSIEAAPTWVDYQLSAQEAAALPQLPAGMTLHTAQQIVVDGATGEIVDDGEWDEELFDVGEEPPTPAESRNESAPKATNGHSQRPLTAEQVQAFIRKKAGWQSGYRVDGEPITEKQVPYCATLTGELFPNLDTAMRDKARHDILSYLFTVTSSKSLTKAEASALIDWSQDQANASIEAARILEAIALQAGQQQMAL